MKKVIALVFYFRLFLINFLNIFKVQTIFFAFVLSSVSAVPLSKYDIHKEPVKRGILDSITHFPFLASSSSAHGSSASSSSSSSSDDDHDFHSHVIHHPDFDFHGHHDDFSHDHNVAISYQNQYFGHSHHSFEDHPTSYHHQNLFDDHFSDFKNFDSLDDSLLKYSHLDAPEYGSDYKNYGGDLGLYSHNAGYLDISNDHKIDNLLDPYSPSHSSYDSY